MYDKKFLYDYLVNFNDFSACRFSGIFDMYDYIIYVDDNDFPNDLPKKLQDFLVNYWWSKNRLLVYENICKSIPEDKIPYYFKNFNVQQLPVIFFALGYGISEEEVRLLMKKGMTPENLISILQSLIEWDWKDIRQIEEKITLNFRTRFSEKRFWEFIMEYTTQHKDYYNEKIIYPKLFYSK